MFGDSHWSNLRSALIGAVVAAVVMMSLPVVAAVGGNLILGQPNSADAVTSLSGAATTNLRITNSQAGAPALDLRVASGAPPLKVGSRTRVANLNADLLDGKHASFFATAAHLHTGVYLPLGGKAADADMLDGLTSTAFAPAGHSHDASAVTTGTLGSDRFSAYSDLVAEGYLNDDAGGDLLTRAQGDGRFLNEGDTAADASRLDGRASWTFAGVGMVCPPGALVGYGRSGPLCSRTVGSATVVAAGDVGQHTSLVLDPSGFPVIAYYDGVNGALQVVHCGDPTCSWGNTIRTVDNAGDVGLYTSLVLDAHGNPVISYYDNTNGDLKVVYCGDPNCDAGNTIRTVDSTGRVGEYSSLVLDASGFPVIGYSDWTNGDLKAVHCGDWTCSAGNTIRTVDGAGSSVGQFASLVLDASGNPVISYLEGGASFDLKLVHCGDPACGAGNTIRTVDSTGNVGLNTSLVLDASGNPVISYYDWTNGDLKVAHCGDATCGAGNTITTVDNAGDVGSFTSLVLDAAGNPVIGYHDFTNKDLKVVHCGNTTCTSGNAIRIVDSTGSVGEYTSLALDASGNPLISYYDNTNDDLKLAALVG